MFVLGMPAAMAVAALHYAGPVEADMQRMRDRAALVAAIHGSEIDLRRHSIGVTIQAHARAIDAGCATALASQAQGRPNNWMRQLRWDQLAWTGEQPDGRVMIAFFEEDGRLPGDRLIFAPADPVAFRATVERVAQACRVERAQDERVMMDDHPGWRSCYFGQMPALELVEMLHGAAPAERPRATMSVFARETPEAELRLLFEGDPQSAEVSFTIAGPDLRRMRIARASFALDGVAVTPQHSLAAYGHTRLRIRMDPFRALKPASSTAEPAYFARLVDSGVATLTLLNASGQAVGSLTFDIGQALTKARLALAATPWSCASSIPAPAPAAQWHLAE